MISLVASNQQQRNFKLDLTEVKKPTHLLPDEYDGIKLVTPERPGPKTKELLERMNKIQVRDMMYGYKIIENPFHVFKLFVEYF